MFARQIVAQATWADVQQQQSVRVAANLPVWAVGGCALLLLASGAVAALGAYDTRAALIRLLAVAAGVLLCCAAMWVAQIESSRIARLHLLDGAGFAAAVGVLLVGAALLALRPANGGPYAGALVALLPIALLGLLDGRGWRSEHVGSPVELVVLAALAIGLVALLFTGERSAVLALAGASLLALVTTWLVRHTAHPFWTLTGLAAIGVVALALWLALVPSIPAFLAERLALWRDALPLIGDYRFIGSGPANTELVYASYVLLTHVPYVAHVHNLYLQVALEYGLFGMAALVGVMVAALVAALQALRHGSGPTQLRAAAIVAALVGTMVLGLVDSEVAASLLVVTLFAPVAAALLVQATARAETHNAGLLEFPPRSGPPSAGVARPGLVVLVVVVGILPVLFVWSFSALPSLQAAWRANEGAVQQAQVELTDYAQAPWPFQDAIRRNKADALAPAEMSYRRALLLNPAQESAHRRMGQIALSLGDVDRAATFLQEAHRLDPQNRVSAQLLGEAYALQGDAESAAALWLPLDFAQNQLETRLNWYRGIESAAELAKMETAVSLYVRRMQEGATQ